MWVIQITFPDGSICWVEQFDAEDGTPHVTSSFHKAHVYTLDFVVAVALVNAERYFDYQDDKGKTHLQKVEVSHEQESKL